MSAAFTLAALLAGVGLGVVIGYRVWGPKWFDTSEGIDRKMRKSLRERRL